MDEQEFRRMLDLFPVVRSRDYCTLTGGTLLSRDKESIVFYRGKDFLPPAVSLAIENHRKQGSFIKDKMDHNIEESKPHEDTSELKIPSDVSAHMHEEKTSLIENTAESLSMVAQNVETRLSQAIAEKVKAEKLLEKLEKASQPSEDETRETITKEERYLLRKVGLKMKQFLLLGRRGVFGGTIENMHLHWKYRELVKIICKEHTIEDVEYAARTLEAESGGILVAVERVSKGHAIIVYRGKNYRRTSTLRPKTLLSKRDALKCSMENQCYKSLKLHVLNLSKKGGAGAWFRSWYLSREEIERGSPSRRDGVSAAREAELWATYCCFIRDICTRLQLCSVGMKKNLDQETTNFLLERWTLLLLMLKHLME